MEVDDELEAALIEAAGDEAVAEEYEFPPDLAELVGGATVPTPIFDSEEVPSMSPATALQTSAVSVLVALCIERRAGSRPVQPVTWWHRDGAGVGRAPGVGD